jgi:hypothetical protein
VVKMVARKIPTTANRAPCNLTNFYISCRFAEA